MRRFRNILIALLVIGLVGFALYQALYLFVLRPTLHVNGQVQKTTIYHNEAVVRQSSTARAFRLGAGTYTIKVVMANGGVVARSFTLGLRQSAVFDPPVSAPKPGSSELVANALGLEPIVEQGALRYLDTEHSVFRQLAGDGSITPLLPGEVTTDTGTTGQAEGEVLDISPLPGGRELLLGDDNTPYVWDGNTATALSLAGIDTDTLAQRFISFGSNPKNDDFVMSVDQTVYHYDSASSDPEEVATLKTRFNRLVFGGGKFLAFDTSMPYATRDISALYAKKYLVFPVLADVATKESTQLDAPLVDASISPDGDHLVAKFRQRDDASLYRVNGMSLQLLNSVARPNVLAPLWTSDRDFIYAASGAIWNYDTASGVSTALADNVPASPSSISLQPDGSLYYTALTNQGQGMIYKLTDRPQLGTADTAKLVRFLYQKPPDTSAYVWTYVDTTSPTFRLQLTYPPIGSNPTEAQAEQSFRNQLRLAGLDPDRFSVTASY